MPEPALTTGPAMDVATDTGYLVADIGGTNARFAVAHRRLDESGIELSNAQSRRVADFESLADAAGDYLRSLSTPPRQAVLAVAGPVAGDDFRFSNNPWQFSVAQLRNELALEALHLVNDFAAAAWAVAALRECDIEAIGTARPGDRRSRVHAVVGPGTGLGVAAVHLDAGKPFVLQSEAGHIAFAAQDDNEIHLLQFLQQRHGRVSAERLLSGDGLLAIYHACCDRAHVATPLTRAEQVTASARDGDAVARQAIRTFCAVFGSFAGDIALAFCAWDGVYLAGGLLAHVFDEQAAAVFRERFENKGRFAGILKNVPTLLIARADVGKLGAAVYATHVLD